jgi:5,10-methenyltetrahydromethanopterin hydrogenase
VKPTPELLKVPFDEIYLPSMGLFYKNATTHVKVRALTGYDEVMLSSPYLAQTGNATKILLNNVILDSNLEYDELLICDRDAIMLFIRSMTFGDEVEMDFICPDCNYESKGNFRISQIEAKEINVPPNENGEFEFLVPSSLVSDNPIQINFSPLRNNNSYLVKDKQLMSRYMAQINSINGVSDKTFILKYLKHMKIKDSKTLREFMDRVEPGFEETTMHSCPSCDFKFKDVIKIDDNFLSLPDTHRNTVNEECFLAYYYGKGITRNQAYEMTTIDRRWTINRISEEIEKQNKAEKSAADKAKAKR